ncbi:mitochondrial potassium channel [Myripristis murdjan]|uniref:Coiled-coil domain containing 51 n=1 Tax=Myripristis murdjan TaxID=586833 RepID=A0A667Y9B9_9TELE|nr:coiled-coil domain-containing protein 51 [Myripristis murdjan]
MRCGAAHISLWSHGSCCVYRLCLPGSLSGRVPVVRTYSTHHQPGPPPPANPTPPGDKGKVEVVKEHAMAGLQHVGELGRQWGQRSARATTATVNYWWDRYEEFVGINEVRDAQAKVTQAEAAFMVARGIVREEHTSLEALQARLKEVRDRLDRVSKGEKRYLDLTTEEHNLIQEERRLRAACDAAQISEREKFALFSAAVRESHEKERTRTERTKNWSIVGSVLGALIGVMGSTYINRVRLQELKSLLLEAQKGPETLQEVLRTQAGNHRSQQDELRILINSFRAALTDRVTPSDQPVSQATSSPSTVPLSAFTELSVSSQRTELLLQALPPQLGQLEQGIGRLESELSAVRGLVEATGQQTETAAGQQRTEKPERLGPWPAEAVLSRLEVTQRSLGDQISRNTVFNAVFSYTAAAVTISAVYLLLRGAG